MDPLPAEPGSEELNSFLKAFGAVEEVSAPKPAGSQWVSVHNEYIMNIYIYWKLYVVMICRSWYMLILDFMWFKML